MLSVPPLAAGRIARFWAPLAATWLMMAAEGPFIAALIARLPEPKLNLAAWGVAIAFAMLIEAPVIMMMSAATALVRDRQSLGALRRFSLALNGGVTAVMLLLLVPPVFSFVARSLLGLPEDVTRLALRATALLLPWPAAIGYRRFYQGVLIRRGQTRRVAYGTVTRLAGMAATALAAYAVAAWPGAAVGALALSAGVVLEAAATRLWAACAVREVAASEPAPGGQPLGPAAIARFYLPLALTSILTIGVHPLVTFLVAHSRMALESLAVLPVVTGFAFVFRSAGLAFQETCIALVGDDGSGRKPLASFGTLLAVASAGGLALVAFTPLSRLWLGGVAGLRPELASFAIAPLRLLALLPALEVLVSFQRALLVLARRTPPITWATAIEVSGIALLIWAATSWLGLVGAVAAAAAMLVGRLGAALVLCRAAAGGCRGEPTAPVLAVR
ncbi:MAG TPA: hypothetical protein P5234_00220 [Thermoanaerobaculaceae bacterium]|nr:hypothetical protein [Thermoanaerobaculaceae bacterium]HRS14654.1 hypothetical protein [Thermoanaerobaculaceae bacterium]